MTQTQVLSLRSRVHSGREKNVHAQLCRRLAGARRVSQRDGIEEGGLGKEQVLHDGRIRKGIEHEVILEHRRMWIQSQSTRISGKGKSTSNDTHSLTPS